MRGDQNKMFGVFSNCQTQLEAPLNRNLYKRDSAITIKAVSFKSNGELLTKEMVEGAAKNRVFASSPIEDKQCKL